MSLLFARPMTLFFSTDHFYYSQICHSGSYLKIRGTIFLSPCPASYSYDTPHTKPAKTGLFCSLSFPPGFPGAYWKEAFKNFTLGSTCYQGCNGSCMKYMTQTYFEFYKLLHTLGPLPLLYSISVSFFLACFPFHCNISGILLMVSC